MTVYWLYSSVNHKKQNVEKTKFIKGQKNKKSSKWWNKYKEWDKIEIKKREVKKCSNRKKWDKIQNLLIFTFQIHTAKSRTSPRGLVDKHVCNIFF